MPDAMYNIRMCSQQGGTRMEKLNLLEILAKNTDKWVNNGAEDMTCGGLLDWFYDNCTQVDLEAIRKDEYVETYHGIAKVDECGQIQDGPIAYMWLSDKV